MKKYTIKYQEIDGVWRSTSYSTPIPVSEMFLIDFFGFNTPQVINYEITEEEV